MFSDKDAKVFKSPNLHVFQISMKQTRRTDIDWNDNKRRNFQPKKVRIF